MFLHCENGSIYNIVIVRPVKQGCPEEQAEVHKGSGRVPATYGCLNVVVIVLSL